MAVAHVTSFGGLMRRYRTSAGLSQEGLAERADMSARAISDLERGVHRAPYPDTLDRIADALELSDTERRELEESSERHRSRHFDTKDARSIGDAIPLLSTKLARPALRPRVVPRPRLIDRLQQGVGGKLVLISAPAGFGKTTLLSAWSAHLPGSEMPLAWVSIDEGDNDLLSF